MKFLQKAVPIILGLMFIYILSLLFFFGSMGYINQRNYIVSNVYSLIFIVVIFTIYYFYNNKKVLSSKNYFIILVCMSFAVFGVQILIQTHGYFTQTWDAGHLVRTVNHFARYGVIDDMAYLTRYPNNFMLTFILVLIRSIPVVGKTNFLILIVNAILVNLSGVMTSLTIRNLTKNNNVSLFVYLVLIPLVLLSPWLLVFYSDTFSILFPITILYIYTKPEKDYRDYFFICFFSFLGFFIKPTVIIVLIAITIVEIFVNIKRIVYFKNWNINSVFKNTFSCLLGILVVLGMNYSAKIYFEYYDVEDVVKFNMVHFMAMGLNEGTDGIYNGNDVSDTMNYGIDQNYDKIKERIFKRNLKDHKDFFARKTLVNFNDGSFAWGQEGAFFINVRESRDKITNFINEIILPNGRYNKLYLLIVEWIWLMVLFFIPFSIKKENNKSELVIMLSIIGVSLFLTLFEARARYLYCYSPIFVVAFTLGITNTKLRMKK